MYESARRITPREMQATLREHNVRPSKAWGQNFLLDLEVVQESLSAGRVGRGDTILEIGPGPGVLTLDLVRAALRVVAVEADKDMMRLLAPLRREHPNLELVQGNVIAMSPRDLVGDGPYKVIANIPYNITSTALRHFLEDEHPPTLMVLLLQREVAERVCAEPGDMSLLSLSVQLYADPEILRYVPASSFYPAPKVSSALVRFMVRDRPLLPRRQILSFFRLAQAGFNDRRKQLHNAMRINLRLPPDAVSVLLDSAGIDGRRRAETLSIEEWGRLTTAAEGIDGVVAPAARP